MKYGDFAIFVEEEVIFPPIGTGFLRYTIYNIYIYILYLSLYIYIYVLFFTYTQYIHTIYCSSYHMCIIAKCYEHL